MMFKVKYQITVFRDVECLTVYWLAANVSEVTLFFKTLVAVHQIRGHQNPEDHKLTSNLTRKC